jgi:SsrA-binding protein
MKVVNSKAKFEYELGERLEVGVVLTGAEAKAARAGQVDMVGAHVRILTQNSKVKSQNLRELWVVNLHIFPYKYADASKFVQTRSRKLLVSRKELLMLESKMKAARYTIVPTAMYTKGPIVKMEIALARGKRMYEKREGIKKRDAQREMEREFK